MAEELGFVGERGFSGDVGAMLVLLCCSASSMPCCSYPGFYFGHLGGVFGLGH